MRCFTPSEFEALDARSYVPPDLATSYFPVLLHGKTDREKRVDSEDIKHALERCLHMTGCWRIILKDENDSLGINREGRSSFRSWKNTPGQSCTNEERISQVVQFSVEDILFQPDLRKAGIIPEPGYLYFCCTTEQKDRSHWASKINGQTRDDYPGDSYFHRDFQCGVYFKDLIDISAIWYSKKSAKNRQAIPAQEKNIEIDTCENVWIGPIGDVAAVTNSLILGAIKGEGGSVSYILKTPLEYPPGFVRETARILKESSSLSPQFVERFSELVFTKTTPPKRNKPINPTLSVNGFNADYPSGEQKPIGPDIWWRYSKDPFVVQTILLARLIGGNFWEYALGNLEHNLEESLEA